MRQVFIDTETTGLEAREGHRIIELAAVEMEGRRVTGRVVHWRINPEREVDEGAARVHGMRWEDLKNEPKFADVANEFIEFTRGTEWLIHNAPFDIGFLNAEFARAGMPSCDQIYGKLTDTLAMARSQFPGRANSLDALCERFGISNEHRVLHGACLDAQLLADVYLALTRGQGSLAMPAVKRDTGIGEKRAAKADLSDKPLRVVRATAEEMAAHEAYIASMK
jgi:DNA polymerase-3 subunit epsilon